MPVLTPPVIVGPVLSTSTEITVTGVLAGAAVEITGTDGALYAHGTATANGAAWINVATPLSEGISLVATQRLGPDASGPSVHPMLVEPPPDTLPMPVFEAILNQCSNAALLSGLVPGATVTIKYGSTVLAVENVTRTRQWIRLNEVLGVGQVLSAQQLIPGRSPSALGWSEHVVLADIENGIGTPQIVGPLSACQSVIDFTNVVPTAEVRAEYADGSGDSWNAPDSAFRALLSKPLIENKVRVRQILPACDYYSSNVGESPVGAERPPPQPYPLSFCPESRRIRVERLVSGARVDFSVALGAPSGPETPLMTGGAVGGTQEFDLPQVVGGPPGPIAYIVVRQTLCTLTSEPGNGREHFRPEEYETGGPARPQPPRIIEPIYSCAQTVRLEPSGWGFGILRSQQTGRQLADRFHGSHTLPVDLKLWFPLVAGEIAVEYVGCNAPQEVRAQVLAVPDPLPNVEIVNPLPGDTDLVVSGALRGARVVALLNNELRSARTATDGTARLPLGEPVKLDDSVWAYQRLCSSIGNVEGSIEVRRGTLSVSVSPASVVSGTAATVTVTATRADTGQAAEGLPVMLGGVNVGVTGTPFTYTAAAPGMVAGKVLGGPRYTDAAFSLTATAPAPPPTGSTLTLQVGGIGGYGNPVHITKLVWRIQPSWAGGSPAVGSGTPITLALPPTPSGTLDPRASIYLDDFEGYRIEGGIPFKLMPDAYAPVVTVGLTKPSFHVGFLLTTEIRDVYDENGNVVDRVWVAVIRWHGTT